MVGDQSVSSAYLRAEMPGVGGRDASASAAEGNMAAEVAGMALSKL